MEIHSAYEKRRRVVDLLSTLPAQQTSSSEVSTSELDLFRHFLKKIAANTGALVMAGTSASELQKICQHRPRTRQLERVRLQLCGETLAVDHETPECAGTKRRHIMTTREDYVSWPASRVRMPQSRGKVLKRKFSPPRRSGGDDNDNRESRDLQQRCNGERRLKDKQDMRQSQAKDVKGKGRMQSSPPRQRAVVECTSDSSSEEEKVANPRMQRPHEHLALSSGDVSPNNDDGSDDGMGTPHGGGKLRSSSKRRYKEDGTLMKPVELDVQGIPHGSMMTSLSTDVKKYAKGLDPTCSWEAQPSPDKYRLFRRLYSDWDMQGPSKKISEKWIAPIITKVLITTRFRLNALIDEDSRRPPEVTPEQWETLVSIRKSDAAVRKSEHMRSISKGKGSKALQMRAIERDAIIKLSILHKRAPYASEIAAEVGRECQRQEEEKLRSTAERTTDLSDVRTRVADMEGTVTRLEDKMDASHQRVEDMVRHLLTTLSPIVGDSLPNAGEKPVQVPITDPVSRRSASPLLPSTDGYVAIPTVNLQDAAFVDKDAQDDGGDFVQKFFPQTTPDGCLPISHVEGTSVAGPSGDGHPSLDDFVRNEGVATMVDGGDVGATGDPEADSYIVDDTDEVEEPLQVEKDVSDVAGDSVGRGRRSMKAVPCVKASKSTVLPKTSKSIASKSCPVSKAPPLSTKFIQSKKVELAKRK